MTSNQTPKFHIDQMVYIIWESQIYPVFVKRIITDTDWSVYDLVWSDARLYPKHEDHPAEVEYENIDESEIYATKEDIIKDLP